MSESCAERGSGGMWRKSWPHIRSGMRSMSPQQHQSDASAFGIHSLCLEPDNFGPLRRGTAKIKRFSSLLEPTEAILSSVRARVISARDHCPVPADSIRIHALDRQDLLKLPHEFPCVKNLVHLVGIFLFTSGHGTRCCGGRWISNRD